MRIEQLEYFLDVSKTKSLNISAERLFVSQPTISEAIHKLEEEMECELLIRSKKGVELTDTGVIVQRWAQEILNSISMMKDEVWQAQGNYNPALKGDICIGATNLSNNVLMPNILAEFLKYYPNVNVRLFNIRHYEIGEFLENDHIDLAIFNWFTQDVIHNLQNEESDLIFGNNMVEHDLLCEEMLQVVAHRNFPISKERVTTIKEVIKYPLVLHLSYMKTEKEIVSFFKEFGEVHVALQADNARLLRQAVLSERGIGLFTKSAFGNAYFEDIADNEALRVIRLKEELNMQYYLSAKKDKKFTMAEKALIEYAKSSCRKR